MPRVPGIVAACVLLSIGAGSLPLGAETLPAAADAATRNAIVMSAIDPGADACDDFYQRACGAFLREARPGDGQPAIDMTARQFDANLEQSLERLFEEEGGRDAELGRLKTFYLSCLDGGQADIAEVDRWLDRIDQAQTPRQLQAVIRQLSAIGADPFFIYSGEPDRAQWDRYRGELRNAFVWGKEPVVAAALQASGRSQAAARREAQAVVRIVDALRAKRGDRWDPATAENPRTIGELARLAPAVEWNAYLRLVGAPRGATINVTAPAYLREVQHQLETASLADLRAFLRWSFLFSLRGELPAPYNAPFGAIGPSLSVKLSDPAARCRDATVRAMGVEFSRQYARRVLGLEARDAARAMAEDIKASVLAAVAENAWLSPQARQATIDKLSRTDLKIGFPDRWPPVGAFPLHRHRFVANVLAARRYEQKRAWSRAQLPRDRTAWDMIVYPWVGDGMAAARLVVPNGFPDAFTNSLIMTAAFLAPPRFAAEAAPELNYATFGTVLAHEFVHIAETHMFGADGRPQELWSDADTAASRKPAACLIEQADTYQVRPGLTLPGADEYDENVADLGGLRIAYAALARRLGPAIDKRDQAGTSPAQRFFYRYAQNYCTAQTDAQLRDGVAGDSHAPASFRVNGPLANMPEFARAFSCKAGTRMTRPAARQCRVW